MSIERIREALADPALFDEGASVDDTLRASERWHAANSPEAIRELLAENERLRAALVAAMEIVQIDRMELYYSCACPVTGKPSPEDDVALARYDAVIAQADVALWSEG
mgnify:FL=1